MSNLSEEEIINKNFNLEDKIKESIQKAKKIIDKTKGYTGDCSEAEGLAFDFQYVQKLLDLYNNEVKISHYLQGELDVTNAKLIEEKEKNTKLDEKFRYAVPDDMINELYISKDKIKNKLNEYEEMLKTCNKKDDVERIKSINERILAYEELLEEKMLILNKEKEQDLLNMDLLKIIMLIIIDITLMIHILQFMV